MRLLLVLSSFETKGNYLSEDNSAIVAYCREEKDVLSPGMPGFVGKGKTLKYCRLSGEKR